MEDNEVDNFVCIVDLDDVQEGEVGEVLEEGHSLLQQEVIIVICTFEH